MPNKALRPFVKERLLLSIIKCCEHRKNSLDDAIALTNTTTAKVMHSGTQSVITAHELTKIVHNTLSKFDTVSAMQYAALHPEYKL
jgi:transcriptional regulator NrdR family protein